MTKCLCGDAWYPDADECPQYEIGYNYCPPCGEHHRPPVCETDRKPHSVIAAEHKARVARQGQECKASHCPPGTDGRCAWPRCAE